MSQRLAVAIYLLALTLLVPASVNGVVETTDDGFSVSSPDSDLQVDFFDEGSKLGYTMFRGTENGFDKATRELKGNASNLILESVCETQSDGTIIAERCLDLKQGTWERGNASLSDSGTHHYGRVFVPLNGNVAYCDGSEVAANAVFNFTAYVLYTPAIALYGPETFELDPDSVKFDMQISSWPFCDEGNMLKVMVKLVTRGSKEARQHMKKSFQELRDELSDSADELAEKIRQMAEEKKDELESKAKDRLETFCQDQTAAQEGEGMTFEQIEISEGIKAVICSDTDLSKEDIQKKMWCFRNGIAEEDCDDAEMMKMEGRGGQDGRKAGGGGRQRPAKGGSSQRGKKRREAITEGRQKLLNKMAGAKKQGGPGKKSDRALGKVPGIGKVLGGNGRVLSVPAGLVDINLALPEEAILDGAVGAIVVEESMGETSTNIAFSFPYFTAEVFYDPVQTDAESGSIGDDSVAEDITKVLQEVTGKVESLVTGEEPAGDSAAAGVFSSMAPALVSGLLSAIVYAVMLA